ncbi:MAG: helix-turn-helix domain-containing protein [Coriobacteriales bacterium]|jgi:transcriptional regulator with XRE-family HTH domain|nr:helix-turn-helix domain-containing protein [Coriobacteriales bacterium]
MNAKDVIEMVQKEEGLSRYQLARRLGVHDSMLSRTVNQKSDPGFNTVSSWLDKLGYALEVTRVPGKEIDAPGAFSVDQFGAFLGTLGDPVNTDYDYLRIHRQVKQLLEHYSPHHSQHHRKPKVTFKPAFIRNREWRAFYAAFLEHLFSDTGQDVPLWVDNESNRALQPWSPLRFPGRAHTRFDPIFKKYNVLLPEGELAWI